MSDMLWMAPEILIEMNKEGGKFVPGTQKGDVYSFAIIVQEILYRNGPFFVSEDHQPPPKGLTFFISYVRSQQNEMILIAVARPQGRDWGSNSEPQTRHRCEAMVLD